MRRPPLAFTLALTLAACGPAVPPASTPPPPPPPVQQQVQQVPPARPTRPPLSTRVRQPPVLEAPGLEDVIGEHAPALRRMFGEPRLDTRDGDVRKLQFAGDACVLDLYLYPIREGSEPEVTWIEARRRSDGLEVDRASCVAALGRN